MSDASIAGFSEIGARLRSARTAAGMSTTDAAERLHCDVQVIEALESGHFEQLGASVFVRGHLRRYGELLGERGDALVEQWAQLDPTRTALPDLTRVPQAPRPADTTRLWQLGALAAGVAVFAIVTWWILQRPSLPVMGPEVVVAPAAAPSTTGETAVEPPPVPVGPEERPLSDAPPAAAPKPSGALAPTSLPASSPASAAKSSPVSAPVPAQTVAASARPNPASVVPAAPAARSTAPVATPAVAPPTKAARSPAATTSPAAAAVPVSGTQRAANAAARLQISLSQECWVEVYDAADKRLYADLAPAGRRIALSGAAPLRVRLGREGVAQLQVNDRAVTPPTAAKRGQTALFTITADGATALVQRD